LVDHCSLGNDLGSLPRYYIFNVYLIRVRPQLNFRLDRLTLRLGDEKVMLNLFDTLKQPFLFSSYSYIEFVDIYNALMEGVFSSVRISDPLERVFIDGDLDWEYLSSQQSLHKQSSWWKDIGKVFGWRDQGGWFDSHISWRVGDGKQVKFCDDIWVGGDKLSSIYCRVYQNSVHKEG